MNNTIEARWVIARFPASSTKGKYILGLADEGVGYVLMNPERTRGEDIIVAFRRVSNQALPYELGYATPEQVSGLEKKRLGRQGAHRST